MSSFFPLLCAFCLSLSGMTFVIWTECQSGFHEVHADYTIYGVQNTVQPRPVLRRVYSTRCVVTCAAEGGTGR